MTVKEILLIGDSSKGNTFIDDLINQGRFKIRKANSPLKALRLLKQNSPDFLLCTGKIRETIDGKYFLELEA
jgi:DNA-binding response OmpR family regulator